jgi:pimeloyl-ACP methyl ester carboxylesterase
VNRYGASGPLVIAIHGGPGAAGYLAPFARELARDFRVLEPYQRGSGGEPLTVARHVEDLREIVESSGEMPALAGHSWGAMLALAFAAAHPRLAGPLVLIGCGTFDEEARAVYNAAVKDQPPPSIDCDFDQRAHDESWNDLLALQQKGVYPAAFAAIRSPVLMLHGADDPHPGRMILASLQPYVPQIEYREFEQCGHYAWQEPAAREPFYAALREWLLSARGTSR